MDDDFRFFRFGLTARLIIAGGLLSAGALVQFLLGSQWPLGLAVSLFGWVPLFLKPATNKPKDQGLEEWRLVSMAEIDRLEDSLRESRKLRKKTGSVGRGFALGLGIPAFLIAFLAGGATGHADVVFVALNALVCLAPAAFFGRVTVFEPKDIGLKMPRFRALLGVGKPEGVTVAPYIRFDKDDKGQDVPEDLRFLFEPKRAPSDLVGIQVQAAINDGPNGPVPYLYAVVLTKGRSGPAHAAASRLRARGFEVEAGGGEDFGTVVIRQSTSGDGYHTTDDDCERLAKLCYDFLASLSASVA